MASLIAIFAIICCSTFSANAASLSKQFTFSASVKQTTLDLHNNFRSQVAQGKVSGQPSASNMINLVWDDQLAAKAKAWSEKCNFEHSDGTKVPGYMWVGENLAVGTMNSPINNDNDLTAQIKAGFNNWANEASSFSFPKTCNKQPCGHYTQLVWAKTQKVGCGLSQCNGMGGWDIGNKLAYLLVCNYGPGGNFNNEDPYVKGNPCSSCAKGCAANKLCN